MSSPELALIAESVRAESRTRQRIRKAVEASGRQVDDARGGIHWTPVSRDTPRQTDEAGWGYAEGGWTVELVGGDYLCGLNVTQLLDLIGQADG